MLMALLNFRTICLINFTIIVSVIFDNKIVQGVLIQGVAINSNSLGDKCASDYMQMCVTPNCCIVTEIRQRNLADIYSLQFAIIVLFFMFSHEFSFQTACLNLFFFFFFICLSIRSKQLDRFLRVKKITTLLKEPPIRTARMCCCVHRSGSVARGWSTLGNDYASFLYLYILLYVPWWLGVAKQCKKRITLIDVLEAKLGISKNTLGESVLRSQAGRA